MRSLTPLAAIALVATTLPAAELPPDVQAKFIKILAASAGSPGKISCRDANLASELGKLGVAAESNAKVAWANSEGEMKSLKSAGKLVICGKVEWLPVGGSIAIVDEGGKPQIYLHMGHISASGVNLSDAVLKIGKKI